MCGICGVYEYGRTEGSVTGDLIVSMRDSMVHRGPDDEGLYITADHRLGLGHRRLSIVDLSPAGRGPMANEDERVWISFNGEIYNHLRFRSELIDLGHEYRSRTDTETLIHLYEERGPEFLKEIEGDFAIALWDERTGSLLLARDPMGVKPLYFAVANGRLIFASEIKAILRHPDVSRDVDEEALYHYLSFLTTPAPLTLFAGIRKLPAGCMLTCNARGEIRVERYWDAISTVDKNPDEVEASEELLRLLSASIEKRMMSDVPFGVFLSGGIDSTANVALMARLMNQPVRTFTVGFRDRPEYNEMEEARWVAREFATAHHEVMIGEQDLLDFIPELIFHQDEPIADPVCVPLYFVARLARETGTTVVQVGEGADELFCGYPDYTRYLRLYDRGWSLAEGLPGPLRRLAATTGTGVLKAAGPLLPARFGKVGPDILRRLRRGESLFWSGALTFDEAHKQSLLTADFRARLGGPDGAFSSYGVVKEDLDRLQERHPRADPLERMIYLELKLRLPELLLMRVDKLTMAASVEARVPFLDHKLVEFAMSLPRDFKYRRGETKWILKRALRGVVPDRVLSRRKQGFGAPISEWMFSRLGSFVEESFATSGINRRDYIDFGFVGELMNRHRSGRLNYAIHLWSLLNLVLWYDQWIEGRSSPVEIAAVSEARV